MDPSALSSAASVWRATDGDSEWMTAFEETAWGGPLVARLGELLDMRTFPAFVASIDGAHAGLARYEIRDNGCEVVSIASLVEGRGVARALLDAIRVVAVEEGCGRLWLVTTNDNARAFRVYQQYGFDLVAFHRNAVTRAHTTLKPRIRERGLSGIRISHELELEMKL